MESARWGQIAHQDVSSSVARGSLGEDRAASVPVGMVPLRAQVQSTRARKGMCARRSGRKTPSTQTLLTNCGKVTSTWWQFRRRVRPSAVVVVMARLAVFPRHPNWPKPEEFNQPKRARLAPISLTSMARKLHRSDTLRSTCRVGRTHLAM